jgi:hemin uptake protein HemP
VRRVAVADLLAGAGQVILLHQGQEYRLRVTRSGKLILTK